MVSLSASGAGKLNAEIAKNSKSKKAKASAYESSDDDAAGDGTPKKAVAAGKPPPDVAPGQARKITDLRKEQFVLSDPPLVQQPWHWHRNIVTTVFWVGEKAAGINTVPNHKSSWDPAWLKNYGGIDEPSRKSRKNFQPSGFVPKQNPFYVALPFNDFIKGGGGHKEEAKKKIPWFEKSYNGPDRSVCKGRWIAIRKGNRVCYAQWEDVGPFTTDDTEYVFGTARPKPNPRDNAGLDVSPAVRDFLGMDGMDVTDWKFVEFEDVPHGPWAEVGDNNHFVINRRKDDKKAAVALSDDKPASATKKSS